MENIQKKIEEVMEKIQGSDDLLEQFKDDPTPVIEKIIGKDLPDDMVEKVVDAVKSKIALDKAGDLLGSLKKLF